MSAASESLAGSSRSIEIQPSSVAAAAWFPANVLLVLAVPGWPAGQEAALYFEAAVLFLLMDALLLLMLMLVFRVGSPLVQTGGADEAAGSGATSA